MLRRGRCRSILAYTGLVKILKKHHKRTGLLVRAPHLDNLLSQPFCSVEVEALALHMHASIFPCHCLLATVGLLHFKMCKHCMRMAFASQ